MEVAMGFVHDQNLKLYRKLVADSESNPNRDEDQHKTLMLLLAEEEARGRKVEAST
jgi:hypothetical protein